MNIWITIGIAMVVLSIGGVFAVNMISADLEKDSDEFSCSTDSNSCSLENNCGLATCRVTTGGSCGCGR